MVHALIGSIHKIEHKMHNIVEFAYQIYRYFLERDLEIEFSQLSTDFIISLMIL